MARSTAQKVVTHGTHRDATKDFLTRARDIASREGWSEAEVFTRWCTAAACSLLNPVWQQAGDKARWDANEERYMRVVAQCRKGGETMVDMAQMLGITAMALQDNLMLMPDEHGAYTTAMKKAMKIMGDDVTALIGHEVASYDQAMKAAMGIAGAKLRNVALAVICETFNALPADMKDEIAKKAHAKIFDKLESDAQAKEDKKAKTDKKTG